MAGLGWTELVAVCRDCRKRGRVPKSLKAKAVMSALKHALPKTRPRPRLVACSCLGVCPKGAVAIAFVGAVAGPRVCVAASLADVAPAAAALLKPSLAPQPQPPLQAVTLPLPATA